MVVQPCRGGKGGKEQWMYNGVYAGYYNQYGSWSPMPNFDISFRADGTCTGSGTDMIGSYTFDGRFVNQHLKLLKTYDMTIVGNSSENLGHSVDIELRSCCLPVGTGAGQGSVAGFFGTFFVGQNGTEGAWYMVPQSRIAGGQPPHELLLRKDPKALRTRRARDSSLSSCWEALISSRASASYRICMIIFAVLCIFCVTRSTGIHSGSYDVDVYPEYQALYRGSTTVGGAWGVATGAAFALLTVVWLTFEECASGRSALDIIRGAGRAEDRRLACGCKAAFVRLMLHVAVVLLLVTQGYVDGSVGEFLRSADDAEPSRCGAVKDMALPGNQSWVRLQTEQKTRGTENATGEATNMYGDVMDKFGTSTHDCVCYWARHESFRNEGCEGYVVYGVEYDRFDGKDCGDSLREGLIGGLSFSAFAIFAAALFGALGLVAWAAAIREAQGISCGGRRAGDMTDLAIKRLDALAARARASAPVASACTVVASSSSSPSPGNAMTMPVATAIAVAKPGDGGVELVGAIKADAISITQM